MAFREDHRSSPLRLKPELTESVLVEDVEGVIAKSHCTPGTRGDLSIDDFGTDCPFDKENVCILAIRPTATTGSDFQAILLDLSPEVSKIFPLCLHRDSLKARSAISHWRAARPCTRAAATCRVNSYGFVLH